MTRGDVCDGGCGRVDMSVAASGASMAASDEVHGEVSGATCDLNANSGYEPMTAGHVMAAAVRRRGSEMSEHVVTRSGGRRRGKQRGWVSQSVRRAIAAKAKVGILAVRLVSSEQRPASVWPVLCAL